MISHRVCTWCFKSMLWARTVKWCVLGSFQIHEKEQILMHIHIKNFIEEFNYYIRDESPI